MPRPLFIAQTTFKLALLTLISCVSQPKSPNTGPVVEKTIRFQAPIHDVWDALTDQIKLASWWNKGVILEPKTEGIFYEPWGNGQLATGKVIALSPPHSITFTWHEKSWRPDQITRCSFMLEQGDDLTVLTVRHEGWAMAFPESQKTMVQGFSGGWDQLLSKLKRFLATSTSPIAK